MTRKDFIESRQLELARTIILKYTEHKAWAYSAEVAEFVTLQEELEKLVSGRPDYKKNDPKGWGGDAKRGAAMGRPTIHDPAFEGHLHVREMPLDEGYDENGTYFGMGKPLYWVANEQLTVDYMIRADDFDDVNKQVREQYPRMRSMDITSAPHNYTDEGDES